MKKRLIGFLTILVVLLSFIGPALYINRAEAVTDPAEWYMTVSGVLDNDYYSLYPYEKNSLTIGFSKFGEMIDPITGTGLNYSGRDPFANEGVDMKYWLNGWVLDARYVHRSYGARHLWAYAMFADMVDYGGDWLNGTADPYGAPHGGRKTNGAAKTDDITVLYNGPRRFVAVLTTHLYDVEGDDIWPVLDITFTIIFNKVKKQVVVLKDIKLTIDTKILEGPVNIQFGDRGEWDLGPAPEWKSYAHFYHQELRTCYDAEWHFSKNITREFYYHNSSFSGGTLQLPDGGTEPYGFPVVESSEYVFVNDVWQRRGEDYTIDYEHGVITFAQTLYNDDVKVYYKLYKVEVIQGQKGEPIALPHLYDLAQIIASDYSVVGYAAFWPTLSDYAVYGWDYSLEPLYNISQPDVPIGEPEIPFIIGEWDFMLDYASATPDWDRQFRGVTVYGIVNWHDADDEQLGGSNVIDREIKYQLDEVFNPWDLRSAIHKATRRHVWIDDVVDLSSVTLPERPFRLAVWDAYCSFAERVLLDGVLLVPRRAGRATYDYYVEVDPDTGYATIYFPSPVTGHLKILYSTDTSYARYDPVLFSWWKNVTWAATVFIDDPGPAETWTDPLGVTHTITIKDFDVYVQNETVLGADHTFVTSGTLDWWAEDIKVFKEDTTTIQVYWIDDWNFTDSDGTLKVTIDDFELLWEIVPPSHTDVHIDWAHLDADYTITVVYNSTTNSYNVTVEISINGYGRRDDQLYDEHIPGRYEWIIVGRDAATIDSAGAALVSAAFKNKQIEIGLAGEDMWDPVIANQMPDIMHKFGTGDTKADYKDDLGRAALKDDWCTTWPIASSNLIAVGGPLANMLAYYANSFTDAYYDEAAGEIVSLSCWTKNAYASSNTVGYAVITTYKDINGTVMLLLWGHWGRDTYYATKWFHEEGIYQLQEAPLCLTTIILQIDYTTHEPAVSIVECLGTITETQWTHGTEVKGGIHDP